MKLILSLTLAVVLAGACAPAAEPPTPTPALPPSPTPPAEATPTPAAATPTPEPIELTLMTHDSFAISDEVLAALEAEHGIRLRVLRAGDAGVMVNQAILARDAPLADILFGVDNTFLSRALEADIFVPYHSPLLDHVPAELQLDPEGRATPIDYGDVCLNYDRAAFDDELPPPASLEDLTDPRYRGMTVVMNPATSSPGLAFLLATASHFGEGDGEAGAPYGWQAFWRDLRANDVLVTAGWSDAYFGHFSGASDGDRPIVVSYATSPVAEVVFAEPQPDEPPTGVVTAGCFRQVEFAAVLAGTPHEERARQVIDFMLSPTFQEDVPLNMFVFPASAQAQVPEVFEAHAARVDEPLTMDPLDIDTQRERLIEEWTNVVLR
jgi:thiamine transport system substrate-binding protein